jgi:Ca2+:H+ antiporter
MAQETTKPAGFALGAEWPLAASLLTVGAFFASGEAIFAGISERLWFTACYGLLFGKILVSAFAIVRHAECLAITLGEPVGTLILTLGVSFFTFTSRRTNVLLGAVDPPLFFTCLISIFDGQSALGESTSC